MKKFISFFVALVMVLSVVPVFADNDASKVMEDVLINVKSKVDIPDEFTEFSPRVYEQNGKNFYCFNWQKEDGNGYIEVNCDSEGRITNYYFYDNALKSHKKITLLSKEDIIEFAEDFLKKSAPETFTEDDFFVFDEESWYVNNNSYVLDFIREKSGYNVKDNYANFRIVVYDDIAYVKDMNINYNYDTEFEYSSVNELETVYKEAYPIELIYKDVYYNNADEDKDKTALVYRNKNNEAGYILASSGEITVEDVENVVFAPGASGGGMKEEALKDSNRNMLTEQEITELENVKDVISKDKADEYLRKLPYINIKRDMKISSYNITKREEDYFVYVNYNNKDEDSYKYAYATFEGKSGKLLNFSSNGNYNYTDTELTDNQKKVVVDKTEKFLKAVVEEEFLQCEEVSSSFGGYRYNADYDRIVNGVRYINDGINIAYDSELGVVTYYSLDFENKSFDSPSSVISEEEAYDALLDVSPLEVIWIKTGGVYQMCWTLSKYGVLIDAFTGKEYNENTYTEQQNYEYSDIKGHWAEEQITKLAEIQIGLEGTEFKPDAPINQFDLLRLFGAGIRYQNYLTYSEDMLYGGFIDEGVLSEEEKNPEGQVLREDAFVYMVRIDGLEKVAKLSDIYKVEYADGNLLSEGKIGYPAILTGMGIICGNGGYLKPKTPITRAEAAVMIYNYMINEN